MAFLLNNGNDQYVGILTLTDATSKPGMAVNPDFSAGTATLCATDDAADGDIYIIANENDNAAEQMIDDLDFAVTVGKYLKLHKPVDGEIITTDQFKGVIGDFAVDDIVAYGNAGTLEAIGARTPKKAFTVIEKPTLWGVSNLKVRVND